MSRAGAAPAVLIADDEAAARRVLERALCARGHPVSVCETGDQALAALLRPEAPRLAILDWSMPGIDGPSVCRELRRRAAAPYLYLVLLTARSRRADRLAGLDAGADDFLSKPFDDEVVAARLRAGARVVELHERLAGAAPPGPDGAPLPAVLVADDDPVSRRSLAAALRRAGHAVSSAAGGLAAWQVLRREPVSVLISDCMMPDLSGLELCRRLRQEPGGRYVYVILMTALGEREDYLLGMEVGADDFLAKPVDTAELQARLRLAGRVVGLQARLSAAG